MRRGSLAASLALLFLIGVRADDPAPGGGLVPFVLAERLRRVETRIVEGDLDGAVLLLRQGVEREPDAPVPADGDRYLPAWLGIPRRIAANPDLAVAYAERYAAEGDRVLTATGPTDLIGQERIARRYAGLPAGDRAALRAAVLAFDRGLPSRARFWTTVPSGPLPAWVEGLLDRIRSLPESAAEVPVVPEDRALPDPDAWDSLAAFTHIEPPLQESQLAYHVALARTLLPDPWLDAGGTLLAVGTHAVVACDPGGIVRWTWRDVPRRVDVRARTVAYAALPGAAADGRFVHFVPDGPPARSVANPIGGTALVESASGIRCCRLEDGEEIWTRPSLGEGLRPVGTPVLDGEDVLVGAIEEGTQSLLLLALDAATGRERRRSIVITVPLSSFPPYCLSIVTAEGILVVTGNGVFARLDRDGSPRGWTLYERGGPGPWIDPRSEEIGTRLGDLVRAQGWVVSQPVRTPDGIWLALPDCDDLLRVDARSGTILQRVSRPLLGGAVHFLGLRDGTLFVQGDRLVAIDAASGEVRWESLSLGRPVARGLLGRERAYLPSEEGWFAVSLAGGRILGRRAWPEGIDAAVGVRVSDGFLVAAGGRLHRVTLGAPLAPAVTLPEGLDEEAAALWEALGSSDPSVREGAAGRAIEDPARWEDLLDRMRASSDPERGRRGDQIDLDIRFVGLREAWRVAAEETEEIPPGMLERLIDERPDVRLAAYRDLPQRVRGHRTAKEAALLDPFAQIRAMVFYGTPYRPEDDLLREAAIENLSDPDWAVRRAAATWLGRGGGDPRVAEALLDRLDDPHDDVRRQAIAALGGYGGEAVVDALARIVRGEDHQDAQRAVASLVEIGGERGTAVLREMLRGGEVNPFLLRRVVLGLGTLGVTEALPDIRPFYEDEDSGLRGDAALAAAELGDAAAADALWESIETAEFAGPYYVRRILALAGIADRRAVVPLISMVDRTPPGVPFREVVDLLGMLTGERFEETEPAALRERWNAWWEDHREEYLGGE